MRACHTGAKTQEYGHNGVLASLWDHQDPCRHSPGAKLGSSWAAQKAGVVFPDPDRWSTGATEPAPASGSSSSPEMPQIMHSNIELQDDPEAFMELLENAVAAWGWPGSKWVGCLLPLLSGKSQLRVSRPEVGHFATGWRYPQQFWSLILSELNCLFTFIQQFQAAGREKCGTKRCILVPSGTGTVRHLATREDNRMGPVQKCSALWYVCSVEAAEEVTRFSANSVSGRHRMWFRGPDPLTLQRNPPQVLSPTFHSLLPIFLFERDY